jgi:hypothetical protein
MVMLALMLTVAVAPAFPFDEAVSMRVNQANQLTWDAPARPVSNWIFRCGEQVKTIIVGNRTQADFGELVTEDGIYTQCGLTAEQNGQVSTPYPIPNFEYGYSYWPVTKLSIELIGFLAALHAVGFVFRRKIARGCLTVMQRVAGQPALTAPGETLDVPVQAHAEIRRP